MPQVYTGLAVDGSGNILVNINAQGLSPIIVKDQADGVGGAAVPAQITQVGGSDGTNLRALLTSTTGQLHVIADSGSTTVVTGTVTVAGNLTNNNAAPGANNVGALTALANAASPSWTEGDQVLASVDLTGRQRVRGTLTHNNAAPAGDHVGALVAIANAAAPKRKPHSPPQKAPSLPQYFTRSPLL